MKKRHFIVILPLVLVFLYAVRNDQPHLGQKHYHSADSTAICKAYKEWLLTPTNEKNEDLETICH